MSEPNVVTILPPELQAILDRGESLKVKCPAGEAVSVRGEDAVYCKIEKSPLGLRTATMAVATFCCHEYGECPTWQADYDDDPIVKRVHEAKERREVERRNAELIAKGIRVDDREDAELTKIIEEELAAEAADPEVDPQDLIDSLPVAKDKGKGKSQIWVPDSARKE